MSGGNRFTGCFTAGRSNPRREVMDPISPRQMLAATAAAGLLTTNTIVNAQSRPFPSQPGDGGASRARPWHATAAEWPYVIDGRCQRVVLDPSGASEINNYGPGDLWFFPKGHGHSIQTIGDKPCHFILAFDNGSFSEHGTFSISD